MKIESDTYIQNRIIHAHFYDNSRLLLDENPQIIKISTQSPDVEKLNTLTNTLHTQVPDFAVSSHSPYRLDVTAVNASDLKVLQSISIHLFMIFLLEIP